MIGVRGDQGVGHCGRSRRRALTPPPSRRSSTKRSPRSPRTPPTGPTRLGLRDRRRPPGPARPGQRRRPRRPRLPATVPCTAVQLLADLVTWLFAFDDRCDEDELGANPGRLAPALTPLLEVLDLFGARPPRPPAPPAGRAVGAPRALHDLCRRIRALGRPSGLLRFSAALREYLFALLWEATNRQLQRVPRLRSTCRCAGTPAPCCPASRSPTSPRRACRPPSTGSTPRVVRLDLLAADLVCWCNDVFSYGKERCATGTIWRRSSRRAELAGTGGADRGGGALQRGAGRVSADGGRGAAPTPTAAGADGAGPAALAARARTTGR